MKLLKLLSPTGKRVTVFYDDIAGYKETDDNNETLIYIRGGHVIRVANPFDEFDQTIADIITSDGATMSALFGSLPDSNDDDVEWDDEEDTDDFSKNN